MSTLPSFIRGQIYMISSTETEKKYIGQTKTHTWSGHYKKYVPYGYASRFKAHINNTKNYKKFGRCRALNSAMAKYGIDTFSVELLLDCDIADLDSNEVRFISQYNTLAPNGYNLESGGNVQKTLSESTRELQSLSRVSFYQTEAGRQLRATHGERMRKNVTSTFDQKKIKQYEAETIDRIHIVHSVNEKLFYVYIYLQGSKKRNKIRFIYADQMSSAIDRMNNTIVHICDDLTRFDVVEEIKKQLVFC